MAVKAYSVTSVNSYIKNMFDQDFLLNRISVKGEVSNCKYHGSGHIYFTLKDATAAMPAVMFAGSRKGLDFELANGQNIIATGSISVYERDGRYQMYVNNITLDGEGDLYVRFETLKKELLEMGMFDEGYKRPICKYPTKIGIVTADTGAAIQDIINISHRRNPYVQLILYPAIVQGSKAKDSIVRGIRYLDKLKVDTIIVGRGGGSIEDLWAFNEREVAQAIFDCETPVISAVGHETDFTIADFVADLRAPTPSAAAELAVNDISLVEEVINDYKERLSYAINDIIREKLISINNYKLKLKYINPANQIAGKREYASNLYDRLDKVIRERLSEYRHRLSLDAERLNGMSPLKKLSEGYSYVSDSKGNNIKSINQVKTEDEIIVTLLDGVVTSKVVNVSDIKVIEE